MRTYRTKKYAPKVRSGCVTCKRRRVKCDERKPVCVRCQKADLVCQGYDIPKTKLFDFIPPRGYWQFEASKLKEDTEDEPAFQLCRTVPSFNIVFKTSSDLDAFQTFVTLTSPMIASYAPQIEPIFTTLIPKLALESTALRHVVIALALNHSRWIKSKMVTSDMASDALCHYNKAIHEIVVNKPPTVIILLVAFVSYCTELMQDNYETAMVHVNGMKSLIQYTEKGESKNATNESANRVFTDVKRIAEFAEGFLHITQERETMTEKEESIKTTAETIRTVRDPLIQNLDRYAQSPRRQENLDELRRFLTLWINQFRKLDQILPPSISRDALRPLFFLAMSLLPGDDAAGFSHARNSGVIEHVLKKVSELRRRKDKDDEISKELDETLKATLLNVIRFYHEPDYQERAASMLTVLSTKHP